MEIIGERITLGRRTTEDGEEKKKRLIAKEEKEERREHRCKANVFIIITGPHCEAMKSAAI